MKHTSEVTGPTGNTGAQDTASTQETEPVFDAPGRMVTLVAPSDDPVSHGERMFYPTRDSSGLLLVEVPIEVYHHFLGPGGHYVYEPLAEE